MVFKVAMKKNLVGVAYKGGKSELKSKGCLELGINVRAVVLWSSVS